MAATNERDIYLRMAERAFYRHPFSDLLIIPVDSYNSSAEEEWKGLNIPVLLVDSGGTVPEATRREIARRKKANLFIWGSQESIPPEAVRKLQAITGGKVFRIMADSPEDPGESAQAREPAGQAEEPLASLPNIHGTADAQETSAGVVPGGQEADEKPDKSSGNYQEHPQYPLPESLPLSDQTIDPLTKSQPQYEQTHEPVPQGQAPETAMPHGQEETALPPLYKFAYKPKEYSFEKYDTAGAAHPAAPPEESSEAVTREYSLDGKKIMVWRLPK